MIYSQLNSNLLLICGSNLALNKASLILRLPTLPTIASIQIEKLLSLFLHLIKCVCDENARVLTHPTWHHSYNTQHGVLTTPRDTMFTKSKNLNIPHHVH